MQQGPGHILQETIFSSSRYTGNNILQDFSYSNIVYSIMIYDIILVIHSRGTHFPAVIFEWLRGSSMFEFSWILFGASEPGVFRFPDMFSWMWSLSQDTASVLSLALAELRKISGSVQNLKDLFVLKNLKKNINLGWTHDFGLDLMIFILYHIISYYIILYHVISYYIMLYLINHVISCYTWLIMIYQELMIPIISEPCSVQTVPMPQQ